MFARIMFCFAVFISISYSHAEDLQINTVVPEDFFKEVPKQKPVEYFMSTHLVSSTRSNEDKSMVFLEKLNLTPNRRNELKKPLEVRVHKVLLTPETDQLVVTQEDIRKATANEFLDRFYGKDRKEIFLGAPFMYGGKPAVAFYYRKKF